MPRWFIPFIALTVFVIVAFLFVRVLRRRKAVTQPACGNCGYFVRGITTFTCPECGQDLREAGIVTPSTHAEGWSSDPVLRAALWTLLLPIPATILSVVAYNSPLTPRQQYATLQRTITGETEAFRGTVHLQQSDVTGYWPLVQSPPPVKRSLMTLHVNGTVAVLHVHLASNSCELYAPVNAWQVLGAFDRAAVIKWLERAGYDAEADARLIPVAQAILDAVNETPNMNPQVAFFGQDENGVALVVAQPVVNRGGSLPVDWAPLPYIGFWLLVWAVGLIVILRRRGGAGDGARRA
jgi:hypothetical protein